MPLFDYIPQPFECEQVNDQDLSNLENLGLQATLGAGPSVGFVILYDLATYGFVAALHSGDWIVKAQDPNASKVFRTYADADFQLRFSAHSS